MKTFGNILWFIFGGFLMSIEAFLSGCLLCITIIFIPWGLQYFKLARFMLWPMGKKVVKTANHNGFKAFLNFLFFITGGIIHYLIYDLLGLIFCITIIGIPFGRQYFKLAHFCLHPLGHDFE